VFDHNILSVNAESATISSIHQQQDTTSFSYNARNCNIFWWIDWVKVLRLT